jgi:uncharacterized protein YecE (DUF72 family)
MKRSPTNASGDERTSAERIRVGIGGWSYEPWRKTFYPEDLPKKSELHYASRHVSTIEINSTFYRLQTASVFAKWRDDTPDDFVFSVKAPRYIVQRRALADGGPALEGFLKSGLAELGNKLGAILWQLPPEKVFDPEDLGSFLRLLPDSVGTTSLRHALEVRHESFRCAEFVDLAREHRIATVYTHSHEYPAIADVTASFVYARLRESVATEPTGYSKDALVAWVERAKHWAKGEVTADLPLIAKPSAASNRDVFIYFINGAKERAPAAAMALLSYLRAES